MNQTSGEQRHRLQHEPEGKLLGQGSCFILHLIHAMGCEFGEASTVGEFLALLLEGFVGGRRVEEALVLVIVEVAAQ